MSWQKWMLITAVLVISGCGATGNVGKNCLQYADRQIPQSYCARQAPKTCRTYCDNYGCRTSCGGGGYCEAYATRTVTYRECVSFTCSAGYQAFEDGCYTSEQIEVRKARRADNALAISAREYGVSRGSDDAVYLAGWTLKLGLHGIDADPARAFAYYERECEGGSGAGCYGLASMLYTPERGVPETRDPDRGMALLRQSCDAGYGPACASIADRVRPGAGNDGAVDPDADFGPALALYEQACRSKDARGCNQAAALFESASVPATRPGARAFGYYERSCASGRPLQSYAMAVGCLNAARYIYNGVDDLAPDTRRARQLVRRARKLSTATAMNDPVTSCIEAGRGSCGLMVADARIGSAGLITDFPNATASELMEAALKLNWGMDGVREDNILARAYSQRACELRDGAGCRFAGELAWYSEDELVSHPYTMERRAELAGNRQEAISWLQKSCNLGHGFGCRMLGNVLFAENPVGSVVSMFGLSVTPTAGADVQGAFTAFLQGCDAGSPLNCEEAAQMVREGHVPDPAPDVRAFALFRQGCEQAVRFESGDSCVYAAQLVYNGAEGVAQDRARAAALMETAQRVATDDDRYDGSSTLAAPKIGHCMLQGDADTC